MPDGKTVNVRLIGDERISRYESEDGYTLIKNEYGYFEYAVHDSNGNLVSSGVIYGDAPPIIEKHLTYKKEVFEAAKRKMSRDKQTIQSFPPLLAGTAKALVLLIEYPDLFHSGPEHDKPYYNDLYFSDTIGSVNHYFTTISYNNLGLNGTSKGWYMSINTRYYYSAKRLTNPDIDAARELVLEAVKAADAAGVDFSQYDLNGDGRVDHLAVIHSGNDAAESYNPLDIWSHSWHLSTEYQTSDGTYVNNYIIIAEESHMGTHAHELLHDFGAPDLYDIAGQSWPIRYWCIMAYGMYGGNPSGVLPPQLCGYLKSDIDANPSNGLNGWLNTYTIPSTQNGRYNLTQLVNSSGNRLYRINMITGNEYFLLENRQPTVYDSSLPDHGIVIYHVDETMPDVVADSINHAANSFYRITVEDGGNSLLLDNAAFSLDDNKTEFNSTSIPNSYSNTGTYTGIDVHNISSSQQNMTFDLIYDGQAQNEFPVVTVSASTFSGDPPLTVQFTGSATDSDGQIISYHYDFGDGSVTTYQNPSHVFTKSGNFTVTLTATDNDGAVGMVTTLISVAGAQNNIKPDVTLSASTTFGKAPLSVHFTGSVSDSDGYITSYRYDFGDNTTSNTLSPTHVFNAAGEYNVVLSASDNNGAVSTASTFIKVTAPSNGGGGGGGCGTIKGSDLKPPSNGQILLDLFILMFPILFIGYRKTRLRQVN